VNYEEDIPVSKRERAQERLWKFESVAKLIRTWCGIRAVEYYDEVAATARPIGSAANRGC